MSADEAWSQLSAARAERVAGLERDLTELDQEIARVAAGNGKLAEAAGAHEARLNNVDKTLSDLRDDVKGLRDGQRNLIIVLVGFAFTVAGSAIALALALGGHP